MVRTWLGSLLAFRKDGVTHHRCRTGLIGRRSSSRVWDLVGGRSRWCRSVWTDVDRCGPGRSGVDVTTGTSGDSPSVTDDRVLKGILHGKEGTVSRPLPRSEPNTTLVSTVSPDGPSGSM